MQPVEIPLYRKIEYNFLLLLLPVKALSALHFPFLRQNIPNIFFLQTHQVDAFLKCMGRKSNLRFTLGTTPKRVQVAGPISAILLLRNTSWNSKESGLESPDYFWIIALES